MSVTILPTFSKYRSAKCVELFLGKKQCRKFGFKYRFYHPKYPKTLLIYKTDADTPAAHCIPQPVLLRQAYDSLTQGCLFIQHSVCIMTGLAMAQLVTTQTGATGTLPLIKLYNHNRQ